MRKGICVWMDPELGEAGAPLFGAECLRRKGEEGCKMKQSQGIDGFRSVNMCGVVNGVRECFVKSAYLL